MTFVGTNSSISNAIPATLKPNIEIKAFTKYPSKYYEEATALIDIDANVEFDVYLSGKITNYVFVDRPIISETGKDTPARDLLAKQSSIHVCGHDSNEIYQAMLKCISQDYDYTERESLKQLFSPQRIVSLILHSIKDFKKNKS